MSVAIHIKNIKKQFDKQTIIPDLSLAVQPGEFFTLLGPSGCGKTTLLRMLAGFNSIEAGSISFNDTVINTVPAHKRNIGMVFQNYALFPHMSVRANVEYGLKLQKIRPDIVKKRTDHILGLVQIKQLQHRLPEKLSGGQQQRVALARAIVIEPAVLLMDEPLSNLDAKLRLEMRIVIREIQNQVGITTVYVTHDQEEALAVSDRIAVMRQGVIQQIGSPEQVYARPANSFVASFIGHSNFLKATVHKEAGSTCLLFSDSYRITMDNLVSGVNNGDAVLVGVRPEEFHLSSQGITMQVRERIFLGHRITYIIHPVCADPTDMEVTAEPGSGWDNLKPDSIIQLAADPKRINVFTPDGASSLIQGVNQ